MPTWLALLGMVVLAAIALAWGWFLLVMIFTVGAGLVR